MHAAICTGFAAVLCCRRGAWLLASDCGLPLLNRSTCNTLVTQPTCNWAARCCSSAPPSCPPSRGGPTCGAWSAGSAHQSLLPKVAGTSAHRHKRRHQQAMLPCCQHSSCSPHTGTQVALSQYTASRLQQRLGRRHAAEMAAAPHTPCSSRTDSGCASR